MHEPEAVGPALRRGLKAVRNAVGGWIPLLGATAYEYFRYHVFDLLWRTSKDMSTKDEIIELVDDLDEEGAAEVLDHVRWLLAGEDELTPDLG